MEKDLLEGNLGTVGKYDLNLKNGNVVLEVGAAVPVGSIAIVATLDGKKVAKTALEWIKEKIPGKYDDIVADLIENEIDKL